MLDIRQAGKKLVGAGLDFICPQICVLCGLERPGSCICELCRRLLPRNALACKRCAEPLDIALADGVFCANCQLHTPPYEFARAPFVYAFPLDCALKSMKFKRQLHYVPAFAEFLLEEINSMAERVDALLPVPLHHWRHARRGFNQAIELCRPLRRATGLPMELNVRRTRATKSQSGLSASERRRNLKDAFAICGTLKCRRPLIVDDVMTTGETCRRLAELLLNNGAEQVGVLVVARSTGGLRGRNIRSEKES